jgi:hypothetical protein
MKIPNLRKSWRVVQVVKCLSSKCEALSSNPSLKGKEENKKERKENLAVETRELLGITGSHL